MYVAWIPSLPKILSSPSMVRTGKSMRPHWRTLTKKLTNYGLPPVELDPFDLPKRLTDDCTQGLS